MLKTTRLCRKLAQKASRANSNEVVGGFSSRLNKIVKNLPPSKMCLPNIGATRKPEFLTPCDKKTFNQLRLVFIKAIVLQYFDLKCHIEMKTVVSGYAIVKVFSQLT